MDEADLPRRLRAWALAKHGELPEPATAEQVAAAEARLGFAVHPLLKRLYLEVADGGYGPDTFTLVPAAQLRRGWPWLTVTVMDAGCAMECNVDCSDATGRVLLMDPNAAGPDEESLFLEAPTLAQWLESWIDGTSWYCDQDGVDFEDIPWPVLWDGAAARLAEGPHMPDGPR
ncbi:MAG: SMI1/KNR4 family protein [Catenulispora sp.]|nr:SMI1/KNR4 family protein [Catenulispora sp.]